MGQHRKVVLGFVKFYMRPYLKKKIRFHTQRNQAAPSPTALCIILWDTLQSNHSTILPEGDYLRL